VVVAAIAPVDLEPAVASVPVQPPDAVQAVALVEDQVRVELPPLATLVGLALIVALGVGAETETVTDWPAEPPGPVQVSVYLVVAVSGEVVCEPLVASVPVQPPDAVQAVALVEDQVSEAVAPLFTVLGLAEKVTAGAGVVTETVAVCSALPPLPVQVKM
jgi:hypothetical protein